MQKGYFERTLHFAQRFEEYVSDVGVYEAREFYFSKSFLAIFHPIFQDCVYNWRFEVAGEGSTSVATWPPPLPCH